MTEDQKQVAIACKVCGRAHAMVALSPGTVAKCVRCGAVITRRTTASLHFTAAFALAALLLYVPANTFPILRLEIYGASTENTALQGAIRLFDDGDYSIAVIVFLASVFVPLLKLIGLFVLVTTTRLKMRRGKMFRTWIYRFIESIGRWAMLDVFVVAILVSLVKLQGLATVMPGLGLLAFTGVVVFTLLASACFDPQLIWEGAEKNEETVP